MDINFFLIVLLTIYCSYVNYFSSSLSREIRGSHKDQAFNLRVLEKEVSSLKKELLKVKKKLKEKKVAK